MQCRRSRDRQSRWPRRADRGRPSVADHGGKCGDVARSILPNRANRVHTSTRTSGSSSQSMGINGRMRQKTRGDVAPSSIIPLQLWRVHRGTRRSKRKQKKKDSVNISQRAALIASGALDEKERDNVCERCNRELYAFRTATGIIMRCRGWDLTGTPCTLIKACQDEAVQFKDKNTSRTEDGDLTTT